MLKSYFELEKRVPLVDKGVASLDDARGFDLSARVAMRFPMERILTLLAPFCKEKTQILNVGSQSGILAFMLGGVHPGVEIYGVEENEFLFEVSNENQTLAALAKSPAKTEFQRAPFTGLPVEDDAADVVVSYMPLHRCGDPVKFLQECARVCKKDGLVFIYDMARDVEEGIVSFILQYVNVGHEEFMASLRASYSVDEAAQILQEAGLENWQIVRESVNLRITSKTI